MIWNVIFPGREGSYLPMLMFVRLRQIQRQRMNDEKKKTDDIESKTSEESKVKDDD